MITSNIRKENLRRGFSVGRLIWLAAILLISAADIFAQYDYQMTLKPRRMGNQLGVEVWVKTLNPDAAALGAMNVGVSYNGSKLLAEDFSLANQPQSKTDSIQFDVNQAEPLPYATISSEFHNKAARGFGNLGGDRISGLVSGTTRYVAILDVNVNDGATGYVPASTGRGSFVGLLRFNILDGGQFLSDADLAEFAFNAYNTLNTTTVMAADGTTNLTAKVEFVNPAAFTIRGITVLNPNQLNQTVNRYPETPYASMRDNHGYPIYFERSGLAAVSGGYYGTSRFAYKFEYSLNSGTSYTEFGRVAESRQRASLTAAADLAKYRLGWIDSLDATDDYWITTGKADVIPTDVATGALTDEPDGPGRNDMGYGGVLRVIWKGDDNFPFRSETAKIRITQIDTVVATAALDETTRESFTAAVRADESDQTFILGRLFFVQLNGSSSYFRSERNFSTPNQFSVEAWVNLNTINGNGTEPGIVVASSGSASDEEGGWMLYLKDGKYPAFRVRKEGGANGEYVGSLSSPVALGTFNPASALDDNHSKNWYHLAATVANNVVKLYVDGELVDSYTNTSAVNVRPMNVKMPVWVGVNPNGGIEANDYFYGGIKEVRVWRYALNQSELRARIAGVYDPDGTVTALGAGPNDNRTALELCFPLQGMRTDVADNLEFQMSTNNLNYYLESSLSATAQNDLINYRPDRSHIKLTAPNGNEGISNLKDNTFDVRWVAYGIGKPSTKPSASYGDVMIQISRDGGNTWFDALDNSTPALPIDNAEVEAGAATWEPYNNATVAGADNDLQGVVDLANNYEKTVLMRISGSEARGQESISYTSPAFKVAPWFAYKNGSDAIVSVKGNTKLNITSQNAFFEAWIKPYNFPENTDGNYYPILAKKDYSKGSEAEATHYALRLLPSGQLQFVLGKYDAATTQYELRTATSDPIYKIIRPNRVEFDSVWVHVGVWVNIPDNGTQSSIVFYVDGAAQEEWSNNAALQASNPIMNQLGTGIALNTTNEYITYIGYEPDLGGATGKRFDGEIKEVRFWGGNPADMNTLTDRTNFIQGALTVRADELGTFGGTDYSKNLIAAYSMNGGSWVPNGIARSFDVYPYDEDLVARLNVSTTAAYKATTPYIKLVEPKYLQAVKNSNTALKVRWVGFDYNRNDAITFLTGDAADNSDLEFSTFGGGGDLNVHYMYTASVKHNAGYTNAASLPTSNAIYEFPGTSAKSQFAMLLNASITDPDENKDGTYDDQAEIGAAMTNGRLRLRARANINTPDPLEYDNGSWGFMQSLITESANFNITPPSNFTVRLLLEGYHRGTGTAMPYNIGDKFSNNGLRIHLFKDNAGRPGEYVANSTAVSSDKYADFATSSDPANRNAGDKNFANVPFVFTDVNDGRYFVVVEHQNYLPVMSQYAAPFYYAGDNITTWDIESGWDFQGWNGSNGLIESAAAKTNPPTFGTSYTAYADDQNYTSDRNSVKWPMTALNYSDGHTATTTGTPLAAMVAGDVYRDGQITAADRAKVRTGAVSYDVTNDVDGDGVVNASDRTIVDNNSNKISSLRNLSLQAQYIYPPSAGIINTNSKLNYIADADPMTVVYPDAPELTEKILKTEREFLANNNTKAVVNSKDMNVTLAGIDYKVTATPYINGNMVEVPMYIQNNGGDFALANCTFAVTFDPSVIKFAEMARTDNVIFSGIDNMGYYESYSAPTKETFNQIPNTRSIEINYDAYSDKSGQIVPKTKTYLGTLRFELLRKDQSIFFNWNPVTVVLTTDGKDVTSKGKFEVIKPIIVAKTFAVTSPNGGEKLEGGLVNVISWTNPNADTKIFIEYSTDKGSSWNRINSNAYDATLLNYNWLTPRINSSECLVRLINTATGLEVDRSDAFFAINATPAEITRPAANDPVYTGGKKDYIRWTTNDKVNVRFEFSENGLDKWTSVTTTVNAANGQIEWTVPVANTKRAVVRMVNATTNEVITVSEPFKILAGSLTITSPRNGDKIKFNEKRPVRWTYSNVNTFTLQYSSNGGSNWINIAQNVKAANKLENWIVPDVCTKNAIVRAIYNNDPELEYNRTAAFEIICSGTDVDDPSALGYFATVSPNPFSESARINFTLPVDANVNVAIYNNLGVRVATILDGKALTAGNHELAIDSKDLASGSYMVRIEAGSVVITREIVKVK